MSKEVVALAHPTGYVIDGKKMDLWCAWALEQGLGVSEKVPIFEDGICAHCGNVLEAAEDIHAAHHAPRRTAARAGRARGRRRTA